MKLIFSILLAVIFLGFGIMLYGLRPLSRTGDNTVTQQIIQKPGSADTVILVTGEWPPLTSEKLLGGGFFSQLVSAVFTEMSAGYEIKYFPWSRCELLVENGDAFAAFPYTGTPDRMAKYLLSDPMYNVATKMFYYKKSKSDFKYTSLNDLKSYKIGGINGYFYLEIFKKNNIQYDISDTEETALQKLVDGKIQLLPLTEINGWDLIRSKYPGREADFGTLSQALDSNSVGLIVSKKLPGAADMLTKYNLALKKIIQNGTYARILKSANKMEGSIIR
jgi:polar amino acid transport system substrate-binding protein